MFKSILYTALCILVFASCTKSGYDEAVVYNSNFNTGDQTGLEGAILYKYNGANIIGRYNNGGFSLNLANLPKHKAIQIEVVPYFHNSWDGNNNYGGIDGPDIWTMYNCSGNNTSSMYRIVKTISHTNSTLNLSFRDFLVQTNVPNPICDESWSMASIVIKVINLP